MGWDRCRCDAICALIPPNGASGIRYVLIFHLSFLLCVASRYSLASKIGDIPSRNTSAHSPHALTFSSRKQGLSSTLDSTAYGWAGALLYRQGSCGNVFSTGVQRLIAAKEVESTYVIRAWDGMAANGKSW